MPSWEGGFGRKALRPVRILGRDPERGALSQSGNRVGKEGKSWCPQESRRQDEEGRGKLRGKAREGRIKEFVLPPVPAPSLAFSLLLALLPIPPTERC